MAASQRVQVLTDRTAELAILGEFIKNPKLIDELTAEVKKLNALTEFEENKAKDARDLIVKGEALAHDLQKQRDDIKVAKELHDKRVEDFEQEVSHVRATSEALKEKELQQKEIDKQHFGERQAIDKMKMDHETKVAADKKKLDDQEAALEIIKARHDTRALELQQFEQTLRDKAEKIKGLMA